LLGFHQSLAPHRFQISQGGFRRGLFPGRFSVFFGCLRSDTRCLVAPDGAQVEQFLRKRGAGIKRVVRADGAWKLELAGQAFRAQPKRRQALRAVLLADGRRDVG
jgi:hypothetical protein